VCVWSARDTALNWARSNKEPIKEIIYPSPRHIHESNLSFASSIQSGCGSYLPVNQTEWSMLPYKVNLLKKKEKQQHF